MTEENMFRIETTTKDGNVFLSPFVYELEEAKEKILSIMSWHKEPKYSTIPVSKFPRAARPEDEVRVSSNIIKAENAWRRYRYEETKEEA